MMKARKNFPYLRRFAHDWPTEELAKAQIKRRRCYLKRGMRRRQALERELEAEDPGVAADTFGDEP